LLPFFFEQQPACACQLMLLRTHMPTPPSCRRTNQLGSTVPSTQRKRAAQHCGSEARQHQPLAKQPRVVA
jgi:hypothetical protein